MPVIAFDCMGRNDDLASLTDRLRALCSRREYCVSDIRRKAVKALDGDTGGADKVVAVLIEDNYVSDFRYASAYARDKSSISGWGAGKIRYMLASKGISRETIEAALMEIDNSRAGIRLEKLLENKYKSLKDDPQCRMKLVRFAFGRGYSYDDVSSLIDGMIKNKD